MFVASTDFSPQLDEDVNSTLDCRYWTTSRASRIETNDQNKSAHHSNVGSDGDDGSSAQDGNRATCLREETFLKKAMSIIGEETK